MEKDYLAESLCGPDRENFPAQSGAAARDRFTRDAVESLVAGNDIDGLAVLAAGFLTACFFPDSPDSEYIGGFTGWSLKPDKLDDRLAFWGMVLMRCDSDSAMRSYLKQSYRNYCSKEKRAVNREYAAFDAQVRRTLNRETGKVFRAAEVTEKHGRKPLVFGLMFWSNPPDRQGVYTGDWTEIVLADKVRRLNDISINRDKNGRCVTEDIVSACECLLEMAGRYCQSSVLSQGLNKIWANCTSLDLAAFIELDERIAVRPGKPSPEDETFLMFDVQALADDFVAANFNEKEICVLLDRVLERADERKERSLHDLAHELGVTHQTVKNIENRVMAKIKAWLSEKDYAAQRDFCRVLPDALEKRCLRCVSINEHDK